jgi:hypothetical protein
MSKLSAPMTDFPIAKLVEEIIDGFRARVELAAVDIVEWHTHGNIRLASKFCRIKVG